MQNIKKEPTFFLEAIPSILADTNAVLVETFAPQKDHLQIKDILKENYTKYSNLKFHTMGPLFMYESFSLCSEMSGLQFCSISN